MIKKFFVLNQSLILLSLLLLILPFLDGGTSLIGQILLFIIPLPLLFFLLAQNNFKIKIDSLFWLSLIFVILALISLFYTTSLNLSLIAFFRLLAFFVFFHLSRIIINRPESLKMALWPVFFAGVSLSLLSLYFLLPWTVKPVSGLNLVSLRYAHNHLAEYLPFVLLPSISLFLSSQKKKKLFFGLLTCFFFVVLLLTFSRTTFLFFPLVLLMMLYHLKIKIKKEKILVNIFLIGSILILTFISIMPFTEFGNKIFIEDGFGFFTKRLIKPINYELRIDYWQQAWQGFWEKPLFGWGWGAFRLVGLRFQKYATVHSWYAHNFYLQTLAELGLLGFSSLMAFLFIAFKKAFRNISQNKNPLLVGLFWALILSACQSFLDFGWEFPAIFLTFLIFLGALNNEKISQ